MSAPGTPQPCAAVGEHVADTMPVAQEPRTEALVHLQSDAPQSSQGDTEEEDAIEWQKRAQNALRAEISSLLSEKEKAAEIADAIAPLLGPLRLHVRAAWYLLQFHYGAHAQDVWHAMWTEAFAGKKGAEAHIDSLQARFDSLTTAPKKVIVAAMWSTVETFRGVVGDLDRPWKLVQDLFSKRKSGLAWNALLCAILLPGTSNII
eukprot:6162069-Amphidinium_carterae.1